MVCGTLDLSPTPPPGIFTVGPCGIKTVAMGDGEVTGRRRSLADPGVRWEQRILGVGRQRTAMKDAETLETGEKGSAGCPALTYSLQTVAADPFQCGLSVGDSPLPALKGVESRL